MHGSIITWRIGEAHRSGTAWERFVDDALVFWAQVSRQPGHLSGHTVRTAADTVVSVNVYTSQEAADAAVGIFLPRVLKELGDRIAFVERTDGSVLDLRWSVT